MSLTNSIESLPAVRRNRFRVSVVTLGPVPVLVNILLRRCDDYGFVYTMPIVVMTVANIVRTTVVPIRIVPSRL